MARGALTRPLAAALPALALVALVFAALFLAGDAETDESRLGRWSPWLFGGALAAVLVLFATIAAQLWRLARERRARAPGARLTSRLALALALIVLPPVLLVYAFSLQFLNATIDSWFDVRIESALDDALELGRVVLAEETARATSAAQQLATDLERLPPEARQAALDTAIDATGALQVALFAPSGALLASAASDPRLLLPTSPDSSVLLRVRDGATDAHSEPLGDDLVIRIVRGAGADAVLQAVFALPARVQPLARNIEDSFHAYQRLAFLRESLKLTFTLILSAVVLLSLLLAVLAALAVARRQVAPVARLAQATREVAAGRYEQELPATGDDELGFLTESFNRMTRELGVASRAAAESQAETETQRAYLETVLERLSSGVLTIDADAQLRTANRAASAILGVDLRAQLDAPLADLARAHVALAPLAELMRRRRAEGASEWREELKLERDDGTQVLLVRAAALPGAAGAPRSTVIVFDDHTVLNQAQREAAWAEVARRLAHEVKNPLTPIQLAAERLRHRLGGKLGAEEAAVLDKSTHTIVAQVEALKNLVNAFGDYARPTQLRLVPLKLNALLAEVLDLYEHEQHVAIVRELDASDPQVRGDAGRLRQLLHNLIKNAFEAANDKPRIHATTRVRAIGSERVVELEIADEGAGLPEGFDASWFEPYRTSKPRGTGLGLAVVRKVVEEHGGVVRAERRTPSGARFIVTLPAMD